MDYTFKGTPGPWVAKMSHSDIPSEDGINGEFQSMSGYVKSGSSSVANVLGIKGTMSNSGWVPYEDAEYNASLIAAAPDLLEALKRAVKWVDDSNSGYQRGTDPEFYIPSWYEGAKQAIHRALNLQP